MRTGHRARPRRLGAIVIGAVVALTMAPAAVAGSTTTEPAEPAAVAASATAESGSDAAVKQVCGETPRPGYAQCLSLVRTDAQSMRTLGEQPTGLGAGDIQAAYALPTGAGAGETVAIVAAFDNPNVEADLAVYREQYGLPPCTTANGCFSKIDQRGGSDYPAPHPQWAGEIALDVQMVSAACPQCHILLVEADDNSFMNLGTAVQTAVAEGAKYVSNSYGTYIEAPEQRDWDVYYDHPGVAMTVASGDFGYGVAYPAASPHVTSVGGTSLRTAGNERGWTETVWTGAGSGCSQYFDKPDFQTDPDCPNRTLTDVSAVADPQTGVAVYNTYQAPGWQVYGGTSASAPIIAGVYALAGQPGSEDYPNSYPYGASGGLHDITSGSNGSCGGSYLCTGVEGYDGPTGLGTPAGISAFAQPGQRGTVAGVVTDAETGDPVADATVSAGEASVVTDDTGRYQLSLLAGDYDLAVSAFGYDSTSAEGLSVSAGQTLTRDFTLSPQERATVSGRVTDGSGHGWPMYARIEVEGAQLDPVFTDPYTGRYRLELPAGETYTLRVTPESTGYETASAEVDVTGSTVRRDVTISADTERCVAAGYDWTYPGAFSDFETGAKPDGWTVIDHTGNGAWRFDDPGGRGNDTGGTGGFAVFDTDVLPDQIEFDSELVTPVADLSDVDAPVLEYDIDYRATSVATGEIDLSLDGGQTWTNLWTARGGYRGLHERIELPQAANQPQVQVRFHYQTINAGWWELDNVMLGERNCSPTEGGILAGQVRDGNTGAYLNGAKVSSDDVDGLTTQTAATPADPALEDGFYTMFVPNSGPHGFTAGRPAYVSDTQQVDVWASDVTRLDFTLGAGHLVAEPNAVDTEVALGNSTQRSVTLTNDGTAPVSVDLRERGSEFELMAAADQGAEVERVEGDFGPGRHEVKVGASAETTPYDAPWTSIANLPGPVRDNAVVTADDGTVYSIGGWDGFRSLNQAVKYDPVRGSWATVNPMAAQRQQPAAAYIDGRIYVVGGWAVNGLPVTALEIYQPETNTWTDGTPAPTAYAASAVTVLDGRMYLVGGCDYQVCGHTDVHVYDPATDSWSRAADYPEPISWASCGAIGQRIYCGGGATDNGTSKNAYVYDPAADGWSPIADLPTDWWGASYAAADGELLISGGVVRQSSVVTNEGVSYDPVTDTWSPLPNSNSTAFRGGGACGFYKVGGATSSGESTRVELLPGYADCGATSDVSWLSLNRDSLTLAPGESATVRVALDAGVAEVTQPGTYVARVGVDNNSPYPADLGVTMRVKAPKQWGKLVGTVTGVRCDGEQEPLSGATIAIDSWATSYTLDTDADGRYELWLDKRNNPLTIVASAAGWRPAVETGVRIQAGKTKTLDFELPTLTTCR